MGNRPRKMDTVRGNQEDRRWTSQSNKNKQKYLGYRFDKDLVY